jgi:hypothetical protein
MATSNAEMEKSRIALCLYGRFNNRLDQNSGTTGFEYIRKSLLSKYDVDVFIYSTDLENAQEISELYKPWVKEIVFEPQKDFVGVLRENQIDESRFDAKQGFRTLSNTLAFLYARGKAIELAANHRWQGGAQYSSVVTARFDLGQLDKLNGNHSHRVSEIGFNPRLDMTYIYSANWRQHDAGYADQWFYSSMENMQTLTTMYDRTVSYFKGDLGYFEFLSTGVTDSCRDDEFANVRFDPDKRHTEKRTYSLAEAVNNHLLHKYFFLETGLYERSKFTSDFGDVANVLYSHTDYDDLWPAFFAQQDKFLGPLRENFMFLNRYSDKVPSHWTQVLYPDSASYTERLSHCLEQIDCKVILFQHEDMFLYGTPNVSALTKILKLLSTSPSRLDYVRFIRGGRYLGSPITGNWKFSRMFKLSPWLLSVQPSFWRREAMLELVSELAGKNIWEFESAGQRVFRRLGIRGATINEKGTRRGKYHWDNAIYPFVATAIVKGKWNISEYRDVLVPILESSAIDPEIRGTT